MYNFYGASRTLEKVADIHWPAGAEGPPLAVPICGFDNENPECQPKGNDINFVPKIQYHVDDE